MFLLFLSLPSRKTSVCPIAHSTTGRIGTVIHDSVKVPYHAQKGQVGRARHPLSLSLHHLHLWALDPGPGRHHPCGFPPKGDFMLQLWAQRWACGRVLGGGDRPGPDCGPLPTLRCWRHDRDAGLWAQPAGLAPTAPVEPGLLPLLLHQQLPVCAPQPLPLCARPVSGPVRPSVCVSLGLCHLPDTGWS